MTTVGFLGSGSIGSTIARLAIEAGHQVVLSNSRGPETLADTAAEPVATATFLVSTTRTRHYVSMETMRRFLVLTPVALGVTAVAYLIFYVASGSSGIGSGVGLALLMALVGAAVVLAAVLIAVGLLRLLNVSNAWAALGLAFGLVAVVLGLNQATIGLDEWSMLFLMVAVGVQVPTWLTFAVGLLVGDLRRRAARNRASLAAGAAISVDL